MTNISLEGSIGTKFGSYIGFQRKFLTTEDYNLCQDS